MQIVHMSLISIYVQLWKKQKFSKKSCPNPKLRTIFSHVTNQHSAILHHRVSQNYIVNMPNSSYRHNVLVLGTLQCWLTLFCIHSTWNRSQFVRFDCESASMRRLTVSYCPLFPLKLGIATLFLSLRREVLKFESTKLALLVLLGTNDGLRVCRNLP